MKLNQLKSMALLALAGSALLATTAHAGAVKTPSTAANGDLLLGVRATGGTGAGLDVVVDLGPITGSTTSQSFTTGTLGSALVSAFGSDWATRSDLQVGAIGTNGPSGTPSPAKALFATNARATATIPSAAWTTASSTTQGGVSSLILTAQSLFKSSSSATAVTQNISDINSWASFLNNGSSFGFFNPSIEGAPSQVLDLFFLPPNAAEVAGTRLGTLKLNADATVTFTSQADVDNANNNASTINFTAAQYNAAAHATTQLVTLTRTGSTVLDASCVVTATAGSAAAPTTATYNVSFPAGLTSVDVTLTGLPDNTTVSGKQFSLSIGSIVGSSLGTTTPSSVVFLPGYDVGGPFLSVTAPIATASVFGTAVAGDVTVTGQADDNVAVASVKVQVNGGAFTSLTLTPPTLLPGNKQNFSQTLTGVLNVINGLNIVRIRATDTNGNTTDVVRNVRYTAKHNLTVAASGTAAAVTFIGKLPDLAAGSYQVGNLYTITAPQFDTGVATTATTASNSFSHWLVGSDTTHYTTRALTFTMSTDLITNPTLTAVYVANPFQSAVTIGTYSGLISVDAGYASTNATHGYLTATVSAGGVLTGSFKLNGILYTFISGNVANDGTVLFGATQALQVPYARFATNPALTATLKFDLVNKVLNGKVYDTTNVSTVVAPLQSATAGALAAGTYTFHLPTSTVPAITDFPQGDTVGTVTVAASGAVTGSITLADTKIGTFSTFVNSAGVFPLYVSPYGATATTTGSLSGLITVGATAGSELTNATNCKWFRPANAFLATGAYAAGWPNGVVVTLAGAKYNSAAAPLYTGAGTSNHASFFASGTGLSSTLTNLVDVSGTSFVKHTSTDTITFLFTSSTGILSGTRGTILYKGVVIQGGTQGIYGYFSTGTATTTGKQGSFTLVP